MGTQTGRCYTKSGSIEKYESSQGPTINSGSGTISVTNSSTGNYSVTLADYDAGTSSDYSATTVVKYGTATKTFYWKEGYAGTIRLTWSAEEHFSRFCIKISCSSFPTEVTEVTVTVSGYIKYSTNSTQPDTSGVTPIMQDTFDKKTVTITDGGYDYLSGKIVTHDMYQTISSSSCTLDTNSVTINSKKYLVKMS